MAREQVSLWHQRLEHINEQRNLFENIIRGDADMKQVINIPFCEACAIGKITRVKFQKQSSAKTSDITGRNTLGYLLTDANSNV